MLPQRHEPAILSARAAAIILLLGGPPILCLGCCYAELYIDMYRYQVNIWPVMMNLLSSGCTFAIGLHNILSYMVTVCLATLVWSWMLIHVFCQICMLRFPAKDIQFYEMFSGHGLLYQEFRGALNSILYYCVVCWNPCIDIYIYILLTFGVYGKYIYHMDPMGYIIQCPYPKVAVGLTRQKLSIYFGK